MGRKISQGGCIIKHTIGQKGKVDVSENIASIVVTVRK